MICECFVVSTQLRERIVLDRVLLAVSLSLLSFTILSAIVLLSVTPSAHADGSSVSTTTVRVAESCSMTSETSVPHEAELHNGLYSDTLYPNGFGSTTIQTFCNDSLGFVIYAIGYTNNEFGNTKLHSDEVGDAHDINTGIYNSGSTANSTWSMKLSSVAGDFAPTISDGTNNTEDFTSWHVIPEEYTKVAYKTTGTDILVNNEGTGSSLTLTYDTYISTTQPAGTYIGQVKYTLVHPSTAGEPELPPGSVPLKDTDCPANSICYAPNASDIEGDMSAIGSITSSSVPATAGKQTITVDASGTAATISDSTTSITLLAPNYKREGYGFAGWSTDFKATNASTIYGPNETITIEAGSLSTNGMILYPVWIASSGNLQGADGQGWTGCSSLTTAPTDDTRATLSSMTALTDTRDENVYTVARLADGKCWMTENLRLDDSVNATTMAAKSQGIGGVFTALPESADLNWSSNASNNLYTGLTTYTLPQLNTNNTNATMMGGTGTNASSTVLTNTPGYPIHTSTTGQQGTTFSWYSYGNYYSWPSAIADTAAHNGNNDHVDTTSICPTGWHLPEGGDKNNSTNSEFWALSVAIIGAEPANISSLLPYYTGSPEGSSASIAIRTYPNNIVYSGFWNGSQANSRGLSGNYWSSSTHSSYYAYRLAFISGIVYPGTIDGIKYYGFSVRCVVGV